jgi:non-ribosomal peptide synthetase component F
MQLKLNFTATEYQCLVRRANAVCMRPTHFARRAVLQTDAHAPLNQIPSNLERLNYLALSRAGNNLNQMMRHLHRTGEPVPADLMPLLVDIVRSLSAASKNGCKNSVGENFLEDFSRIGRRFFGKI